MSETETRPFVVAILLQAGEVVVQAVAWVIAPSENAALGGAVRAAVERHPRHAILTLSVIDTANPPAFIDPVPAARAGEVGDNG